MGGDPSAYAALGLEPGADAAAVERAYKRLIKAHHPDREGGCSKRAAELNRAYRDLNGPRLKEAIEFHEHPDEVQRRPVWIVAGGALAAGLAAGLFLAGPMGQFWTTSRAAPPIVRDSAVAAPDLMNQPLNLSAIDEAALEALRMSRFEDEMALAAASRNCHHALRTAPSLSQLDRCAAFDDAVVQLQDRDPLRDQGPFGELAVTGRLWSGASALSDDYLAIDGRLDRIRLRVELQLAADQPA
jgi:curved DNA-binding protein CbpA